MAATDGGVNRITTGQFDDKTTVTGVPSAKEGSRSELRTEDHQLTGKDNQRASRNRSGLI